MDGGDEEALKRELAEAAEQLAGSQALNRELTGEMEELRVRAAAAEDLRKEYVEISNSLAYRAGRLTVEAFTRPGLRTLLLPFRLVRLVAERLIVSRLS